MKDIVKLKDFSKDMVVLYVEDDISIQKSMNLYLKKIFKKVLIGSDGLEGLELYKINKIDIVITDLSMPRMDGIDMLKKIKEIDKEQSILITSAHSETKYMFNAIKIGIDGYIIKPFDFGQLNAELLKIVTKLYKFKENEELKNNLSNLVDLKTKEITKMMALEHENYNKTLASMVEMIEERDRYTAGHSKRVARYSKLLAEKLLYSEEDCEMVYQAAILHDIGKIATPDAVLLSPKQLNEIEYKLIQEHVEVGYRILNNSSMFKALANIVYQHHERYNGKGYPQGMSGEDIVPLARIVMVADSFDAMTTNRIYKKRKSVKDAIKEIKSLSGIDYHSEVVEVCEDALVGITIDETVNQLPQTKLEEERFAYFYKDILTSLYNKDYLDFVLAQNQYDKKYKYLYIFNIKMFSIYNQKNSWDLGDKFLNNFASVLVESYNGDLVFRIFGDDFVVVSKNKCNNCNDKIDKLVQKNSLDYDTKVLTIDDLSLESINNNFFSR